jgi:hypothetical protein
MLSGTWYTQKLVVTDCLMEFLLAPMNLTGFRKMAPMLENEKMLEVCRRDKSAKAEGRDQKKCCREGNLLLSQRLDIELRFLKSLVRTWLSKCFVLRPRWNEMVCNSLSWVLLMSFRATDVPVMCCLEPRTLVKCRTWALVGGKMNIYPTMWRLVESFHFLDKTKRLKSAICKANEGRCAQHIQS